MPFSPTSAKVGEGPGAPENPVLGVLWFVGFSFVFCGALGLKEESIFIIL